MKMNDNPVIIAFFQRVVQNMILKNEREIECPCRKCKNMVLFDPYKGTLRTHLMKHGFMENYTLPPNHDDDDSDEDGDEDGGEEDSRDGGDKDYSQSLK